MERQHTQGKGREILARCCQDIPVYTADESVLTQLTGFHLTRGMLCAMRRPKLPSVEDVCRNARRVVVLENVMNPTNIGAIFRSAAALGMDVLCVSKVWMWLKGGEFAATPPEFAGDVDLREAAWYAYNWKDKKYEALTVSDGICQITEAFIDEGNNVKLVAASAKKGPASGGDGGGCNTGAYAALPLLSLLLGVSAVRKKIK